MTTGESAVEKPCADTTVLRFKIDAMQSTIEHLKLKVSEASEAALRGVRAAMKAVGGRDPDPEPMDYDHFADERRFYQRLLRERSSSPGPGSINGMRSKLMDAVIWVILAVSAWNLKATIDNSRDIAVLQCQINPTCAQAVVRGNP